ncbi:DNA-binding SARP family transcriptional activator/DNA-binding CsgD family transcriptional regulator [Actinokineospora baliensis]|uniref:BTAD domain-containing putative transcriptional regulator n=1 Tax=Actinokineospora baliensis TaxID=547056 RepID=UPI00195706EA|nr:BTAD domain-containing putative transcriptional regulator [Actinokineospora baliensis]MBM7774829.1 DNA-binding SARP family transcriptional activator/DNA-binding CsgD family transcriptional regulator [Actinokineospora baliensis]
MGDVLTAEPVRVRVLGPMRAWRGDTELALGPARQRAVLGMLAARAGIAVPTADLVDGIWGDDPPASARGSLHTYVSGLRRALGDARALLESTTAGYRLRVDPAAVDATAFDLARTTAAQQGEDGDWRGARQRLDDALTLWHGDAYAGVPGPSAELERHRLTESRARALELRVRAVMELGAHSEAVAELTELVARDPRDERLREHLMLALHRSGRRTDALAVYDDTRRALADELGIEPGPALRALHERIVTRDPSLHHAADRAPRRLLVLPATVTRSDLLGRSTEVSTLRGLVAEAAAGRGNAVWVEGEPGLGKSALLAAALADAADQGCQLGWASPTDQRAPLQVILRCLAVDVGSSDPRRADLAAQLTRDPDHHGWGPADPTPAAVDRLLDLVDRVCAAAPLVLVLDDLHRADPASVLVWHRLTAATRQLPLLLVAATRPAPGSAEVGRARRGVLSRGGHVLTLDLLATADAESLLGGLVGAGPGPRLRTMAARAAGNPLYLREMAHALTRTGAVEVTDGIAEVAPSTVALAPRSLLSAVHQTVELLSPDTRALLRSAALLGVEFGVEELAEVAGLAVAELVVRLDEALTASVVVEAGDRLAFRHSLLRQAVYESMSAGERTVAHRAAAAALTRVGASVERVAEQLAAGEVPADPWVTGWLVAHHATIGNRAPLVAVAVLERAVDTGARVASLHAALARAQFRLGRDPSSAATAGLDLDPDPAQAAEMRHLLAAACHRAGAGEEAITRLRAALAVEDVPELWRVRHQSLLANFRRGDLADLSAAELSAVDAHAEALAPYPKAHAAQTLWLVHSIRRDHERALGWVDRAITEVGAHAELRFDLLDNRMFTLQNLDRLDEAEDSLRTARAVAARHSLPAGMQVSAAVHHYWTGRWDEALAELETVTEDGPAITFYGMREPGSAALLLHGVAALIAGRRGDRAQAAAHLDAARAHQPSTDSERESYDFHLAATALAAEQRGDLPEALRLLEPVLRPDYARLMLRHQWLPDVIRLALAAGSTSVAEQALAVSIEEASKEVTPARAAAALAHCQTLITGDPAPALSAATHYREVGRPVELATALADATIALATQGDVEAATATRTEATALFTARSAHWDLHRLDTRMQTLGHPRPTQYPAAEALSPLEKRIAELVTHGMSNPEIGTALSLPRRTIQSHVATILAKLGSTSRSALTTHLP